MFVTADSCATEENFQTNEESRFGYFWTDKGVLENLRVKVYSVVDNIPKVATLEKLGF